jgi:hypothetical protein
LSQQESFNIELTVRGRTPAQVTYVGIEPASQHATQSPIR